VFEWVRECNRLMAARQMAPAQAAAALAAWEKVDEVLGVSAAAETAIPPEIMELAEARQAARKAKDFARADALRQELKNRGWLVEDTPKGPKLKPV
jgi:cysteinyl-tRNA synthetase